MEWNAKASVSTGPRSDNRTIRQTLGQNSACRYPKHFKTPYFEDHQAAFPAKLCLSVAESWTQAVISVRSGRIWKRQKAGHKRSLLLVRIEFGSDREAGSDHEMVIFVLPCILVPLRRNIGTLMIGKERQICDLNSLSQIL